MLFLHRRMNGKWIVRSAMALLLAVSSPAFAQQTHVVGQGHTLGKIAKRYNTTVEALCDANQINRRTPLKVGQKLVIPDPPGTKKTSTPTTPPSASKAENTKPTPEKTEEYTTHIVASGHTLGAISRRYRTTVEAIQQANNLQPRQKLRVGACLVVPLTRHALPRHRTQKLPCQPEDSKDNSKESSSQTAPTPPAISPKPPSQSGVIHLVRGGSTFRGRVLDRKGHPIPSAVEKIDSLLFDRRAGSTHSTDLGLIAKIAQVSDHFGGRRLIVVSGYRQESSNPYTTRSNHALGRAIDFRIEGVSNEQLRDYCHTLTGVGVGYYPNSTFIHLDVRSITTHWTDVSGPGEAPQYTTVTTPTPPRTKSRKRP